MAFSIKKQRGMLYGLLFNSSFMLGASQSAAEELCGSKEGYLNTLASNFLIPDYFPPETEVLKDLIPEGSDIGQCGEKFGLVHLGETCEQHDRCYESIDSNKSACDRELRDQWVKTCRSQYRERGNLSERLKMAACRVSCEWFVKLMSEAQTSNNRGFCPSCDAFDAAQNDRR